MKVNKEEYAKIQEWIKALKSGDYKQGDTVLYNEDTDSYCCLGVYQKIHNIECGSVSYLTRSHSRTSIVESIPFKLQEILAGLNDENGDWESFIGNNDDALYNYILDNNPQTFEELADLIDFIYEEELEETTE